MSNPRHAVVAIDMGYGHLRPAYAVAEALGTDVLQVDQAPLARDKDQKLWAYVRQYYESVSRASQWPVFGLPLRTLLERVTDIRDLYAERDQSRPNISAEVLDRVIKKGLGSTLVNYLEQRDATLVTTFFMPAIAADRLGYDKIFCIVTDSDIQRVWAPMDPGNTRINYLVPSQRTRRRLRAYGVPESRIRVTGFPLPHRLVGGTDMQELKQNLGRRLVRLDPSGIFRKDLKHAISQFLGPLPELSGAATVPVLTFAVGGAGAQVGLADSFLPGLRSLLDERRLELVLVAGIRAEVAEQLRECVRRAGLARQLEAGGNIRIVYEVDFPGYLDTFNGVLAQTDVLWTKPSEMTFFAGLGLPLVFSEPVGTHEQYNRRWAREEGAGLKQRDPRFAGEWLKDWLKDGTLAAAAWNGFTRMPSHGLYQILDALGVEEGADGVDRVSDIRDFGAASNAK
jgi:hypothetical protein